MKIYGSLFLWVPLTIFLIWLGIKELPDEVLKIIKYVIVGGFLIWNIIVIIIFLSDKNMIKECKDMINKPLANLPFIIMTPILIIPLVTYYLNDKLTIKI